MSAIKDAWDYVYGSKSHMNIAGKIVLGVPMFPVIAVFVLTWTLLEFLFTKEGR
jgi:hypothetical protein